MSLSKPSPTVADVADVMEATASQDDAGATFRAVEALARRTVGHKLFTVMRNIEASQEVERLHSSNPAAYPVGGRKQKEGTRWGGIVLDRGEVFLARNPDELRAAFPDHELIRSLGIGAILNVPIRLAGRCIGTMNLCGDAGQYGDADIAPGKVLAALLVPAVISTESYSS
jgi:GAF domain-containing protein